MKHYPSISIAIPTYNEAANVDRCLSSIFRQKYPGRLEVLVIDGGSTDNTLEFAKKYPVRILHNPMKQAEYGKKIALMKSTGDYFMILDCDMDLVGQYWFERMVEPLEKDKSIVGSWTKFVSDANDAPLNKYITLDPIQRDPMFSYLTSTINACVTRINDNYWILAYKRNQMLPAGFCIYRRKQILSTEIKRLAKFMELDNLVILLNHGLSKYAYIQNIGIHHPFLTTLSNLVSKRKRNIETMYFNQPSDRYWTWIDWHSLNEKIRIVLWIIYVYLLVPSVLVGLWKCAKYKTWLGVYEFPFNLLTTSVIAVQFLKNSEGRNLLYEGT